MPRRLALIVLACVALVGCGGGGKVNFSEVESDPPSLPIPRDETSGPTGLDDAESSVTPTPTPDDEDTTTTDPSTAATAAPVAPATTAAPAATAPPVTETAPETTGGAAPPAEATAPPETGGGVTAPSGDDQFCTDNPGACNE